VPLKEDIASYFEREVRPHVPDSWMDRSKDKVIRRSGVSRFPPAERRLEFQRALRALARQARRPDDPPPRPREGSPSVQAPVCREPDRLDPAVLWRFEIECQS
jgi:hypothetical protein